MNIVRASECRQLTRTHGAWDTFVDVTRLQRRSSGASLSWQAAEHTSCRDSWQNAHSVKGDSTSARITRKQPLASWPLYAARPLAASEKECWLSVEIRRNH